MRDYLLLELLGVRVLPMADLGGGHIFISDNDILLVDAGLPMSSVFSLARKILPQAVTAAAKATP